METNEKLRQEIAQLSHLIASSNNVGVTGSSVFPVYSNASGSIRIPRPLYQPYPSLSLNRVQNGRSHPAQAPQYPNPFRYSLVKNYVKNVFPGPSSYIDGSRVESGESKNKCSSISQYKVDRKKGRNVKISNSDEVDDKPNLMATSIPPDSENSHIPTPTTIYINPLHFAKSNQEPGTSSSFTIRPHLNPAFSRNSNLESLSETYSADKTDHVILDATAQQPLGLPLIDAAHLPNGSRSKYKLDRRIKCTPAARRKSLKSNSCFKTKVFKQFSMRLVPRSSLALSGNSFYPSRCRSKKSIVHAFRTVPKSNAGQLLNLAIPIRRSKSKKGLKGVVSIDGNKYVRKNGGKTLKRVSPKNSPAVVFIGGKQFIQRNGGKSLKRLSDSRLRSTKVKSGNPIVVQTPGVRMAHRAIAKSKLALSQKRWRKKQFCVFYNRFGECKKNESGDCPYIHDRNLLTICPKFVVGKCTNSECKLSHDLNVGRMMPCRFFNKSECSRENCPYPHVKSTPLSRKSNTLKEAGGGKGFPRKSTGTPRKHVTSSTSKIALRKKKEKKDFTKNPEEEKSRYYKEELNSQPTISIIPRRLPLKTAKDHGSGGSVSHVTNLTQSSNNSGDLVKLDSKPTDDSRIIVTDGHNAVMSSPTKGLRTRLMNKMSTLHSRVKKESTAPKFLSFN